MYWCNKSIRNVVEIKTGVNDKLSLITNTGTVSITIPSGLYFTDYFRHTSDLIDEINKQFAIGGIAVTAKLGGMFGDIQFNDSLDPTNILETWSNYGGADWIVENGKLKLTVNSSTPRVIYHPYELNERNYKVSATLMAKEDDDVMGIAFRYVDTNNFYYVGYESGTMNGGLSYGSEKIRIYKVVNGVSTIIGRTTGVEAWELNTEFRLELEAIDNEFHVYLDGVKVLTITDDTFSKGSYGFFGISQIFYLHDLEIAKNIPSSSIVDGVEEPRKNLAVFAHDDEVNDIKSIGGTMLSVLAL